MLKKKKKIYKNNLSSFHILHFSNKGILHNFNIQNQQSLNYKNMIHEHNIFTFQQIYKFQALYLSKI